jgi:uncharacterized protein (TIGR02145 family)
MQFKDIKRFFGGINKDIDSIFLPDGDYVDGFNIRTGSSDESHNAGHAETLQGEVEILINAIADITYYGSAIGGEFQYHGYEEVQIGTQVFMKKNWDFNYPGSKVYNDLEANRAIYGGLYTWNQAMEVNFCPAGWHVPTEAEIDTLLTYLGGAMIAGGKMKEPDTTHWLTPNTGADDSSGFKALPGGKFDALFSLLGANGLLWLQDEGAYATEELAGVVSVDVVGEDFLKSAKTPYIHGSLYYNGFIYGSPRVSDPADGIIKIIKVCANDYLDIKLIPIRYSSESDTQAIYYIEQIQRIGYYIYASAFATVSGTATNLLIQLDTRDDSYKIFKITDAYGLCSALPIICDDTHIYYPVNLSSGDPDFFSNISIIKYLASDFQVGSWNKFSTSVYSHTGVPVVPVSVTAFFPNDYYVIHTFTQDDTYIYASFMYNWIPVTAGKLLKINKATMAIAGTANIPNC